MGAIPVDVYINFICVKKRFIPNKIKYLIINKVLRGRKFYVA